MNYPAASSEVLREKKSFATQQAAGNKTHSDSTRCEQTFYPYGHVCPVKEIAGVKRV